MSPTPIPLCVDGGESVDAITIGRPLQYLERVLRDRAGGCTEEVPAVLGADDQLFLGNDLLPWLLLAVGGALVVANIAALIRPPRAEGTTSTSERVERPPLGRVLPLIVLGLVVSVWAGASLLH